MKFRAIARTLLAGVSSRARVWGLLVTGAVGIIVAIALSGSASEGGRNPVEVAAGLVDGFGLSLLIPVAALVFGTAALGDPIEDGTYVYLWLRPIRRWQITAAAYVVTLGLVVPLGVVPTVVSAAVIEHSSATIVAAAAAAMIEAIAYSAVFVLLGQLTQRALVWGIAYLLIFEEFICRGGKALGTFSVHSHAVSMLSKSLSLDLPLSYYPRVTAGVIAMVMTVVLLGLSARRQQSMSVA